MTLVYTSFALHQLLARLPVDTGMASVLITRLDPLRKQWQDWARYPGAIEEAYAATKWVAENGKTINVDSSRLAVAGDSVGGSMADAITLLAKERGGPKINFQALFYPVTDAD